MFSLREIKNPTAKLTKSQDLGNFENLQDIAKFLIETCTEHRQDFAWFKNFEEVKKYNDEIVLNCILDRNFYAAEELSKDLINRFKKIELDDLDLPIIQSIDIDGSFYALKVDEEIQLGDNIYYITKD